MLTVFSIPKAFTGHFAVIQWNAIRSWALLGHDVEVILFGDDDGVAEVAAEFRLRHHPHVKRNEHGTPLLDDLFNQAEDLASDDQLCYVNADILLMHDFAEAVRDCRRSRRRFLMVGQRTDFDQHDRIDFEHGGWSDSLRARVETHGTPHKPTGIDYFVFRRGMWGSIPPFAIGRFSWDNWLIHRALQLHIPVIDATPRVLAVHQNHDYSHAAGGARGARNGPEARQNYQLAGGMKQSFTIWDSTHVLTSDGVEKRRVDAGLGGGIWSYRRSIKVG